MSESRNLIDAHCHLADPRWVDRAGEILDRARKEGIELFIQGGVSPEDWGRQRSLAAKFPGKVFCTFGLHPWWVAAHSDVECEGAFADLEREFAHAGPSLVGLGELGLDLSERAPARDPEHQLRWMERQLDLAEKLSVPIVLHIVKAHEPALTLLEKRGRSRIRRGGLVHSFSAGPEEGRRYLQLGLTLSVSGVVARSKGYERLKKSVAELPLESFVCESDCPDQPSPRFAGGLNGPEAIWDVARAILEAQGGAPSDVAVRDYLAQSSERVCGIFGL